LRSSARRGRKPATSSGGTPRPPASGAGSIPAGSPSRSCTESAAATERRSASTSATGRRAATTKADDKSLAAFRARARQVKDDARAGIDPKAKAREAKTAETEEQERIASATVDNLLDRYLKLDVRARGLRTGDDIETAFKRLVRPTLGKRSKYTLKRGDIVSLLDEIADANGKRMADLVLAYLSAAFRWEERRDEDFRSPIVAGMARLRPKAQARARILSDEELRDLWAALDAVKKVPTPYPRYVRCLLLTAARRTEIAAMPWEEISRGDGDDVLWILPPERSKSKIENALPLPPDVLALLGEPQRSGFVFSSNGGGAAMRGFSKSKAALDKAIAEIRTKDGRPPMPRWTYHDLRRTARSLMSRASVPADIGERVLGHVIGGVRGVYDRHSFIHEKGEALLKLAALVERIINPPSNGNVVALDEARVHIWQELRVQHDEPAHLQSKEEAESCSLAGVPL
jgi:hypothetical protein